MGRKKGKNGPGYAAQQGSSHYGGFNNQNRVPVERSPVKDSYIIGENLGSETRSVEFKAGPGFVQHGYRENVSKYVCAFANSQENGKLLLGVNDNGEVSGYSVTHHEEDKLRQDTDAAIKDIIPPIFPSDYSVHFVPVHDEHNTCIGNLKVIEICVYGVSLANKDVLYSNKKGAYQRRDGGTHELSAYEIQEWTQQRFKGEMNKYKKNSENFEKELHNRDIVRRQLEEKLQEKDGELRRREIHIDKLANQLKQCEMEKSSLFAENEENREKLDILKSEQDNEVPNQQVLERLDRIEHNLSTKQQKSSKVCVIS